MRLPLDYCLCQGWECDKRESCARYTSLDYTNLEPRATVMRRLCDYDIPSMGQVHFIDVDELKEKVETCQ